MRGLTTARPYQGFFSRAVLFLIASILIVTVYLQTIANAGTVLWPSGGTSTSISAGLEHSCAVASGAAYCWGRGASGQLGQGSTVSSSVPVAVDTSGALNGKTVTSVSVGDAHSCAVADGRAYCWGSGGAGRLGQGSTSSSNVPVAVDTSGVLSGKTVTRIAASVDFTCAIASGAAYCWGFGGNGELGNGGISNSTTPVAVTMSGVLNGKTVTEIDSGDSHSCVVASDQAAYCWGDGSFGQLGQGSKTGSNVPVAVSTSGVLGGKTVTAVTTSDEHSCAVASGAAYCWGQGSGGRLGRGSNTDSTVPVEVDTSGVLSGKTVTRISAMIDFTCAVASGAAYCWGFGGNGELGNGGISNSTSPVAVTASGVLSGTTMTEISSGDSHSCAIASGHVYCWGLDDYDQLGNSSAGSSTVPVAVVNQADFVGSSYRLYAGASSLQPGTPLAPINQPAAIPLGGGVLNGGASQVSAGYQHTCAVIQEKAYCWGYGNLGGLGDGTYTSSLVPIAVDTSGVLNGKTVTAVSAGYSTSCAIADGAAYCWGYNSSGQVGAGTTTFAHSAPQAVDTSGVLNGKTVTAISVGSGVSCAIADGAAYCWGSNSVNQIGDGVFGNSTVPRAVSTSGVLNGKTVTAISVGSISTCAIADGAAYCWGANTSGQIGDGTTTNAPLPQAVSTSGVLNGKTVTAISADTGACVVASGKSYCWGANDKGQLGTGAVSPYSSVPVAVDTTGDLNGKTVTDASIGAGYSCALASGALYCWGSNSNGQLGRGAAGDSLMPIAVDTSQALAGLTIDGLEAGNSFSCGVSSGSLYCWGKGLDGQLGEGDTVDEYTPVQVAPPQAPVDPLTTFRLRVGLGASTATIPAGVNDFSLQYAQRTGATCSVQTTGFSAVSDTSDISWYAQPGLTSGSAITALANDPVVSGFNNPQRYLHTGSTFSNTAVIESSKSGLWDFSLRNSSLTDGAVYCLRIAYSDGTPLEQYVSYPQVNISSTGIIIGFVDTSGNTVASPSFAMTSRSMSASCQTSTATIGSLSGTRLRASQGNTSSGWSVSIAPTNGSTSAWTRTDNAAYYDFNDPSGSPPGCNSGSDGDGLAGQMSLDLNTTNVASMSGCTSTGMSWGGSSTAFSSTISAITLTTASSSSQIGCYWDIYNTQLSQTIPPDQQPGDYVMDLTATVVAQ